MAADQVLEAGSDGFCSIGSHTMTHADLVRIAPSELKHELVESKAALEHLLGRVVDDLALPFGAYNEEVMAAAFSAGYRRVFTLDSRLHDDRHETSVIGRFSMSLDVWRIEFVLTCAGAYAWLDAWRRCVRYVRSVLSPRWKEGLSPA